jgi:hypothetical protein
MATTRVPLDQSSVEMVIALQRYSGEPFESAIAHVLEEALRRRSQPQEQKPSETPTRNQVKRFRIALMGEAYEAVRARDVLITVLQRLHELDGQFLSKLSRQTGRTRRIVASTPDARYPGRPDLAKYSHRLTKDWWVGTNYSTRDIDRIVRLACSVAGLEFGVDLVVVGPGWAAAPTDRLDVAGRGVIRRRDGAVPASLSRTTH